MCYLQIQKLAVLFAWTSNQWLLVLKTFCQFFSSTIPTLSDVFYHDYNVNISKFKYFQMLGESEYARKIVTVSHDDGKVIYYSRPQYPIVFLFLFLCICIIAFFFFFYLSLYVFLSLHASEYIAYWELWCLTDKKEWRHISCWFQFRCWRTYLPKSTKDIYFSSSINSCSRRGSISFSRFLMSFANFNVGAFFISTQLEHQMYQINLLH